MFLYRGGQTVSKGTYWEPNSGARLTLTDSGFLPGGRKVWYYRLPESYFLIPIILLAVGISMAFPYGMGAALCVVLYVTYKVLFSLSFLAERLLRELAAALLFGYKPNLSFFSGIARRVKRRRKEKKGTKK